MAPWSSSSIPPSGSTTSAASVIQRRTSYTQRSMRVCVGRQLVACRRVEPAVNRRYDSWRVRAGRRSTRLRGCRRASRIAGAPDVPELPSSSDGLGIGGTGRIASLSAWEAFTYAKADAKARALTVTNVLPMTQTLCQSPIATPPQSTAPSSRYDDSSRPRRSSWSVHRSSVWTAAHNRRALPFEERRRPSASRHGCSAIR
jgi:hypothetical protein